MDSSSLTHLYPIMAFIGWLVIALILAGWTFANAKEAGNPTTVATLWAVISFWLLIFGVMIWLVVRKTTGQSEVLKAKQDREKNLKSGMADPEELQLVPEGVDRFISCPFCHEDVPIYARSCRYCGNKLH